MDNKVEIVDFSGKPIHVNDTNKVKKIKKYIRDNIWNILGIGIAGCVTVVNLINLFVSEHYSQDCSKYYGIDKKYFDGSNLFQDKLNFLVVVFIALLYLFFMYYINVKIKSKICSVFSFVAVVFLLFAQNIAYTVNYIDSLRCEWLKSIIDNNITVIIFLISDIVLAYFLILRVYFRKKMLLTKGEKIVFTLVLGIYLLNSIIGITQVLNTQISDKKSYETIDNDKVVITNYEGKFLIMDCEIEGKVLKIKEKGKYSFIEMTNVVVQYNDYENVEFE